MEKQYFFFDLDENVRKCEIYLCFSRKGLPNPENLLMWEHLKTCAKEPISLTLFLDHHSHTLRVSAHLTPWKWRLHDSISTHWVSLTKNIFGNVFLEMILQQFEIRASSYFGVFTCMVKMGHQRTMQMVMGVSRELVPPSSPCMQNTQKYDEVLTSNFCKIISRNTFPKIFCVSDNQCIEIESRKRHFHGVRCAETRKVCL